MGNGNPEILITAKIDESVSAKNFDASINKLGKQVVPVEVPFQFNLRDSTKVQAQINKLVSEITKNKGNVIDYKINVDSNGSATSALIKYRNELDQVTQATVKLKDTGNKLPDGTALYEWAEGHKTLSHNIEQTIKKNEALISSDKKLSNTKAELLSQMKLLHTQSSNVSLNKENLKGFGTSIRTNDIEQARHYLALLRTEYQTLNSVMSKGLPENAIENLDKRILNMSTSITTIGNKFRTLGNAVPKDLDLRLNELRNDLTAIEKKTNPQAKLNAYNELIKKVQVLNNEYKVTAQTTRLNNRNRNLETDKLKFLAKMQAWLKKNSKAAKMCSADIKNISSQVKGADRATLTNLGKQFGAVQKKAEAVGKTGRSLVDELKNDIAKIGMWLGGGTVVFGAIHQIKSMISTVSELNKEIVDLQMATGGTVESTEKLLEQYNVLGKEIGATTVEVANSSEEWLRQGKSIEDTNTLTKDSIILSKVAKIDSAKATEYLTSAMKGFNISAKDTIGIVDKLSAVDMASATSAGGLAEGMSKVATVANMSGISIDKLIGYLAIVGETTQKSLDEIGTSFQAIFSRMGNVKAGKFVDDNGEELNDVEKVLNKVGIHLRDTQGQFRNFGTVLDEVASKWKQYNSVEKNAITTSIAGTRQRENLTVLLNGYSKATEYATLSANSHGTATKKMEAYDKSVEAANKRLTASFEELSSTLINSDLIKFFVDLGSKGLNALTGINKGLGTIPTLAGAAVAALSLLGKNAGRNMPSYVKLVA